MCDLYEYIDGKRPGWKVVAINRKTGRYHSVATGIMYPKNRTITPPSICKAPINFFNQNILNPSSCLFSHDMIGRTAIFTCKDNAEGLLSEIQDEHFEYIRNKSKEFDFLVVPAIVSVDIMRGEYQGDLVYAGKKITFPNATV